MDNLNIFENFPQFCRKWVNLSMEPQHLKREIYPLSILFTTVVELLQYFLCMYMANFGSNFIADVFLQYWFSTVKIYYGKIWTLCSLLTIKNCIIKTSIDFNYLCLALLFSKEIPTKSGTVFPIMVRNYRDIHITEEMYPN